MDFVKKWGKTTQRDKEQEWIEHENINIQRMIIKIFQRLSWKARKVDRSIEKKNKSYIWQIFWIGTISIFQWDVFATTGYDVSIKIIEE